MNDFDLILIRDVGKIAVVNLMAGLFTFIFYQIFIERLLSFGKNLITSLLPFLKPNYANFFVGCFALGVVFLVYAFIYAIGLFSWRLLDEEEKHIIKRLLNFPISIFRRFLGIKREVL